MSISWTIEFCVGGRSEILEREFSPEFTAEDLAGLPNHSIYVKLMVKGEVKRPFSGEAFCIYIEPIILSE